MPILFAPLALLLPAIPAGDTAQDVAALLGEPDVAASSSLQSIAGGLSTTWQPRPARQVRIERRVVLRIAPRRVNAARPENRPQVRYRRVEMGDCMAMTEIGAVRPVGDDRLLFFKRGGGVVTAQLERSCSARAFYSGFYVERSEDGQMCVSRERLRSRSGASCQLTSMDRLEPVSEQR